MSQHSLVEEILSNVDESDLREDSTLQSADELAPILNSLFDAREKVEVIVSLGSGSGGFVSALGNLLNASEVHAIDRSPDALEEASSIGLETHRLDLEHETIPLSADSADLVVSLGLLEHLTWYDNVIEETYRIANCDGFCMFAMPNMAGWTNRLSLLTGHQPRNVEFSKQKPYGILDAYDADYTVGHVHTPTVNAFEAFLQHHDFEPLETVGLHPYQQGRFVKIVDRLVSGRPSLCRRFAVLAQRKSKP